MSWVGNRIDMWYIDIYQKILKIKSMKKSAKIMKNIDIVTICPDETSSSLHK